MPVLSRTRHVACDGAFNIRDLGGYTTADGRALRWQVLYRADGLHRIPTATTSSLGHLAVEQLVAWLLDTQPDLREEMARQPEAILSCPSQAMLVFLDELRLRHGSVEAYLTAVGVEPATLDRLREGLLEPA